MISYNSMDTQWKILSTSQDIHLKRTSLKQVIKFNHFKHDSRHWKVKTWKLTLQTNNVVLEYILSFNNLMMKNEIFQDINHIGMNSSVTPACAECTHWPLVTRLVAASDRGGLLAYSNFEIECGIRLNIQVWRIVHGYMLK